MSALPMNLKGRVAVVTGAASGIGRATALSLARRGCHLALVDRQDEALADTAQAAQALGVAVSRHRLDVTDRAACADLPARVMAEHHRVDVLINNAGVALGGTFEQVSTEDFDWLLDINFHAVVRLTRAFLPCLRESDDARLVNVSSVYGLISPPGQAAYSASKFAVRGFSNALRHELAGSPVGVSVVHPGGVATAIARNARLPKDAALDAAELQRRVAQAESMLRLPPERAGEIIVRGLEQRRARILVGGDAHVISWIERLLPVSYWGVISALLPKS